MPTPTIALLGNSITREGVDTAHRRGNRARRLARTKLRDQRMQPERDAGATSQTSGARPAAVAYGLRPEDMGRGDDIDLDKAFAYAMGGFVKAWAPSWTRGSSRH